MSTKDISHRTKHDSVSTAHKQVTILLVICLSLSFFFQSQEKDKERKKVQTTKVLQGLNGQQ